MKGRAALSEYQREREKIYIYINFFFFLLEETQTQTGADKVKRPVDIVVSVRGFIKSPAADDDDDTA